MKAKENSNTASSVEEYDRIISAINFKTDAQSVNNIGTLKHAEQLFIKRKEIAIEMHNTGSLIYHEQLRQIYDRLDFQIKQVLGLL